MTDRVRDRGRFARIDDRDDAVVEDPLCFGERLARGADVDEFRGAREGDRGVARTA